MNPEVIPQLLFAIIFTLLKVNTIVLFFDAGRGTAGLWDTFRTMPFVDEFFPTNHGAKIRRREGVLQLILVACN